MNSFLVTLKSRREAARLRVEAAEADFRKWSDAVELEERGEYDASEGEATQRLATLTLDSVRRKEDILRTALRTAGRPLKPTEILEMVKPAMSRASVYLLANQLKENGELVEHEGKFSLVSVNGNGNGHHAPVATTPEKKTSERVETAEPDFGGFMADLSDRGKSFISVLTQHPQGIEANALAPLLGLNEAIQIGGFTGGGLAKIAKKFRIRMKDIYKSEVSFPNKKRTRMFYPGKLLKNRPLQMEKPAV